MTLNHKQNNGQLENEGGGILEELDHIDDDLHGELVEDKRLQDGVPDEQREDDLDFIQMTGVTRRESVQSPATDQDESDADASRPVSFYEKGVADVDSTMVPGTLEDAADADQEIVPEPTEQEPVKELRDVIADLTAEAAESEEAAASVADMAQEAVDTGAEAAAEWPTAETEEEEAPEEAAPAAEKEPAEEEVAAPAAAELGARTEEREGFAAVPTDLLEAERLVQELQNQPRDLPPAPRSEEEEDFEATEDLAPVVEDAGADRDLGDEEGSGPDDAVYSRPSLGRGRRRSSMHRGSRRRVARVVLFLLVLAAIAGGLYQMYVWFEVQWAAPGKLYAEAAELAEKGQYRRASAAFQQFAATHPSDPRRPDAQFQAAYALQRIEGGTAGERREMHESALRLFEQFIRDNQTYKDSKLARAEVMTGILHFKLGNYQKAIDVLGNPELRLRDPGAALASVRVLAHAHAEAGDYEGARDAYLQAAGMGGNRTPDEDYCALAEMYDALASRADTQMERQYKEMAVLHWRNAVQVPGINPVIKTEIRNRLNRLAESIPQGALDTAAPGQLGADDGGSATSEQRPVQPAEETAGTKTGLQGSGTSEASQGGE